jgi:hypothetical protein
MTGSKFRMSAGGTRPRNQGPLGRTKPGGKLGTYSSILGYIMKIWIQIPEPYTYSAVYNGKLDIFYGIFERQVTWKIWHTVKIQKIGHIFR